MTRLNTQSRLTTIFCLAVTLGCSEEAPEPAGNQGAVGPQPSVTQPTPGQMPVAQMPGAIPGSPAAQPNASAGASGQGDVQTPGAAITPEAQQPAAAGDLGAGATAPPSTSGPAVDMSQMVDTPVEPAPVSSAPTPEPAAPSTDMMGMGAGGAGTDDPMAAADELPEDSCSGIGNGDACETPGTCSNLSCGLADTGSRVCTCDAVWDCTSCTFPMGDDQPSVIVPPTEDAPIPACDATMVVEKEACPTMGDRCALDGEICACWLTDSDGQLIWDCDDAPSFWD